MAKSKLSGNPDATLNEAKEILKAAREEAKDQKRGLRARQAAEKVWLAVSTAADAMSGGRITKASQVFSMFEKAWGATGKRIAMEVEGSMHRGCFYSNAEICDGSYVNEHILKVGKIFVKAIRDPEIKKRIERKCQPPPPQGGGLRKGAILM